MMGFEGRDHCVRPTANHGKMRLQSVQILSGTKIASQNRRAFRFASRKRIAGR